MDKVRHDRWFNLGADARYRGRPLRVNPGTDQHERKYWREGWLHMNGCWGIDVPNWNRPLMPVEA